MTMKYDRESDAGDATDTSDRDDLDEKLDPIVAGWQTALTDPDRDEAQAADDNDTTTAADVARGDDLGSDRPD